LFDRLLRSEPEVLLPLLTVDGVSRGLEECAPQRIVEQECRLY
jgi:hypothetical protein